MEQIPHSNVLITLLGKYNYCEEFDTILLSIPERIFDQKIAESAVRFREHAIADIPDKFISEKMAHMALKADPGLISSVPDRYRTFEMCEKALFTPTEDKEPFSLFRAIPHPELVMEVLFSKMYEDVPVSHIAGSIPKESINNTVAEELVRRDANCLPHIPFHLKNESICLKAIRGAKTIEPLYAIPRDSMTNALCAELVSKFPQAVGCILPEEKRSPEICLMAVRKDGTLDKFVPDAIKNSKDMNIYRFAMLVDKKIDETLSYNQIRDLFEGKTLAIKNNVTSNPPGSNDMVNVRYNRTQKTLDYSYAPLKNNSDTHKAINRTPPAIKKRHL